MASPASVSLTDGSGISPPVDISDDVDMIHSATEHKDDSNRKFLAPTIPNDYVPLYVGSQTLKDAGITDTRKDALFVQMRINLLFPNLPLTSDHLHYSYNANSKLRFVSSFLGSKDGLGIIAPILPEQIVRQSEADIDTPDRERAWHHTLIEQMQKYGKVLTDPDGDSITKDTACEELALHLDRLSNTGIASDSNAGRSQTPLFNGRVVKRWEDLLIQPSQIILPRSAQSRSQNNQTPNSVHSGSEYRSYQLALYARTPLISYVIACVLHTYTMLKEVSEPITTALGVILSDSNATTFSTDSTDSEEEWQTHRNRRSLRQHTPKLRQKDIQTKIDNIVNSQAYRTLLPDYNIVTQAPLTALAMNVRVRAMRYKYILCCH